jgi:hypothetical protein
MNRTYRKDKKESNNPGEDEHTTNVWDRLRHLREAQTTQHLTAEFEQMQTRRKWW